MIPWFIVNLVSAIASLFGRVAYVRARSGGWGAERIYLMPIVPGAARPRRLKAYRGTPVLTAATDLAGPRIEVEVAGWDADASPIGRPAT